MPHPSRRPPDGSRAGYTLVELLGVLVLAAALMTVLLKGPPVDPHAEVVGAAHTVRAAMLAALERAEADGTGATFQVDTATDRGRYRVSTDTAAPPDAGWHALRPELVFSSGGAPVGALGEDSASIRIPSTVGCAAGVCDLGGADAVAFYITHSRHQTAVTAVVLSTDGLVRAFRYRPGHGVWQAGLQ